MTVWADDAEKESNLFSNVQIEIGCDETDLWLSFNKATAAVQFTHAEAVRLIADMQNALREATKVEFSEDLGAGKEEA
jgi:hypothetical protein